MNGLLIDLDGVIYEGETMIAGAAKAMAWVRSQEIPRLFLTNTTSKPRSALVDKLAEMGIESSEREILTPPLAARRWLERHVEGPVALFVAEATKAEFEGLQTVEAESGGEAAAIVVGDMSEAWNYATLNAAFRLLMSDSPPVLVALGMTRFWHAPDGLRLDTAPFVMALTHASGIEPTVLGKPAKPFFEMALAELGYAPEDTWMIGDDIRTDIEGAQQVGIGTVLLRTGKFRTSDLELGIRPGFVLGSIAELPSRWSDIDS